jgi:hypothetical protein
LLVVPDQTDGSETVQSLLLGDMEAALGSDYHALNFRWENAEDRSRLQTWLQQSALSHLSVRSQQRPRPQLYIEQPEQLFGSEYETPTQLEMLFYYPHRWFFRQQLRIFPGALLSISRDNTLNGNLAHRFLEELLRLENIASWNRPTVQDWIDKRAETLLPREGATLLLYGREPERLSFLNKVKNAAWSLISILRNNGWQVESTEMELSGEFVGMPVRGKADLVLKRGDELAIVDFKWSGATRRKDLIRNGEDLQLVLYAHLLPPPERWPHTAYFILEEGRMIARNNAAFQEAIVAGNADDHSIVCAAIFSKMERTYRWRLEQIRKGQVEIRTSRTAIELESLYEGQLFDILEMKNDDAKWDEYRILIGA